jgi:hypothetical protein
MTSVKELADAEAARAEAEGEPDAEPAAPTEPTTPTEPTEPAAPGTGDADEDGEPTEPNEGATARAAVASAPDSFTLSEALNTKLERERKRHGTAMKNLLDDADQDVMPCPICERLDAAPIIVGHIAAIPDEGWQQLQQIAGVEAVPPFAKAKGVVPCPECNAIGQVEYPTHNQHMKYQTCLTCAGNGYLPEQQAEQPPAPVVTLPTFPTTTPQVPPPFAGKDQWGRPAGHPHFNVDPASIGA